MSNIYKNAIEIHKQDANHYRDKYIDAIHTISLRDEEIDDLYKGCKLLKADNKELKHRLNEAKCGGINQ